MTRTFESLKWRNITVSGRAASGATTLSKYLAKKLGWQLINGGEMVRLYCKENNIPLEKTTMTSDEYHISLDKFIMKKLKVEKNLIIESWLSGFDAKNINGIFKIFTICSEDAVRIDRLVNRDKMTVEEAKTHLKIREEENLKKWQKIYKTSDFWNPNLYDLVINTYTSGPTESLEIALSAIGYYNQNQRS